jgi:type I restriction enzyme S subunit
VSWRRCRLDWLTSEERGAVNPTEISADTVFHYSIPALDEIGDGRLEHPDEIGSGKLLLSGGEVLISKLNPRLPRVLLAEAHDVPTLASTEFIALRPGPNVDERFLRYWLGSEPLRQMLNGATMSVTRSQERVRPEIVTKSWLRVPSIDDQRSIADYLDRETARIDALIEKKQNLLILLERRLIQLAYSLTVAKGGTIPLRRVVRQVKTGTTPPASDFDRLRDGDRPWYSPGDVRPWMVLDTPSRCLDADAFDEGWVPAFPANSTLVVGIGATAGRVAHLGHLASGNQQMTCLVPGPQILPRFLSWQLLARAEELRATAPFTTLPILNNDFLRAIPLFVPTIEKQAAIVGDLDELADKLQKVSQLLGRQIGLLQERRQALITAAVTGELEIPGVAA